MTCKHRRRERATHLLRSGRVGTIEQCRCGAQRVVYRRESTDWKPAGAHPEIPPLLSLSSKP